LIEDCYLAKMNKSFLTFVTGLYRYVVKAFYPVKNNVDMPKISTNPSFLSCAHNVNGRIIYALRCPVTNNPTFISQCIVGSGDPLFYIKNISYGNKINDWISYLNSTGYDPIIEILDYGYDDSLMAAKEKFWIEYFISKGHLLLNQESVSSSTLQNIETSALDQDDPLYDIRVYVKTRRKLLKLTQLELSSKSGLGLRFIRGIEQGKKTNFSTDCIIKLLNCLGRVKITIKNV